jgi:phosphopantothenoylcysteine decarboxylase/phosphopantothenate--cysteine ligase
MAECIVLGVTGSIAAYKAVDLLRLMTKKGWDVHVVMTRAATRFVGELTFRTLSRHPVHVDLFADPESWEPDHVALADRADAMVVAPCTANVLAKLSLGLADDLLAATALALRGPLVVAPAMNAGMWEHPATREHVGRLQERGVRLVDVGAGELACGVYGSGRMAEPPLVLAAVEECL